MELLNLALFKKANSIRSIYTRAKEFNNSFRLITQIRGRIRMTFSLLKLSLKIGKANNLPLNY